MFTFLQPATFAFLGSIPEQPMHAATRKHPPMLTPNCAPIKPPKLASLPPQQVENIFIDALVQASVCRRHMRHSWGQPWASIPAQSHHKALRRHNIAARQIRHFHHKITTSRRSPFTREDYVNLVDIYREPFTTHAMDTQNEPCPPFADIRATKARYSMPLTMQQPTNTYEEDHRMKIQATLPDGVIETPSPSDSIEAVEELDQSTLGESRPLRQQCVKDLLNVLKGDGCTHETAFQAYSELPSPGVSLLTRKEIRLLFRRLSVIEQKSQDSMLHYLFVVDDMKATDLPMKQAEWNSAIAFCGRCLAIVKAAEVENAIVTWKEMENEAGVKSGNVTFNILFDIATKAGKFVLAEMILKEMEARELHVNRYARVGLIYYHGVKGDGDGVRKAYRELIEGGEIVDTVVINCVIASLIRAGEPASAEQIYERMKNLLQRRTGPWAVPRYNWMDTRDLGRSLDRAARYFRHQPKMLQQIRGEQLLAPDVHTFAIFVEHHASRTGELRRIVALLAEMKYLGVPMHGRIFLKIFKGFASHGGMRYTSWTRPRLESVWNALLDALDEDNDVKIMKWMVVWALKAFERCAGSERTLEIWDELRKRWEPGGGELEDVIAMWKGS